MCECRMRLVKEEGSLHLAVPNPSCRLQLQFRALALPLEELQALMNALDKGQSSPHVAIRQSRVWTVSLARKCLR